ncbi:MAG TPA: hypothetical protein VF297_10575 [Pyrinomonadaceae bacterium]
MKSTRVIVSSICTLVILSVTSHAKEWRGIIPMKSTCEDVKRVLGVDTCNPPDGVYDLGGEEVRINFSKSPCVEAFGKSWSVPVGTVLAILHRPKSPVDIAQLALDVSKYKITNTDVVGLDAYHNEEEGIWFEAFEGTAQNIHYLPAKRDARLQCKADGLKSAKAKKRRKS